jgi:hypothetical protein
VGKGLSRFYTLSPLYLYQAEPITRQEEYSAEKSCHAHVERADAQERPAELSSKQLPNPKPCPAKREIKQQAPDTPAPPQMEGCAVQCAKHDTKKKSWKRHLSLSFIQSGEA